MQRLSGPSRASPCREEFTLARDRLLNGLHKLNETNAMVDGMKASASPAVALGGPACSGCLQACFSLRQLVGAPPCLLKRPRLALFAQIELAELQPVLEAKSKSTAELLQKAGAGTWPSPLWRWALAPCA